MFAVLIAEKWFEESKELLAQSVKSGKVERIIKLFDKEKKKVYNAAM